jgi:rhomboid protease GluP
MDTNNLDNSDELLEEEYIEEELKGFNYFKAWIKSFPITALCILISIVLFGLVSYSTYFENTKYPEYVRSYLALIKYGAVLGGPAQTLLWSGEIWRIFVNLFHHGGILHVFFNLYALYYFGSFTEKFLGSFKYLLFIIFCGLCQAIICQLTIEPGAIGLSGIVFGLFGFLFIISKFEPLMKRVITPELSRAMFIQLFIFIPLTYFNIINIANVGHFSGLFYGILFAGAFYYKQNIIKKISFILLNIFIITGIYYVYQPINNPEYKEWKEKINVQK